MWKAIAKVLFWTYERGSLPYDLMCGAILAFIFLTPPEVFDGTIFSDSPQDPHSVAEPAPQSPPRQSAADKTKTPPEQEKTAPQ